MRTVKANDETGRWIVFENRGWLAEFESESIAIEFALVPKMIEFIQAVEESGFVHDGDGDYSGGHLLAEARDILKELREG